MLKCALAICLFGSGASYSQSTFSTSISSAKDDMEEYVRGTVVFDESSSDLEMVTEGGGQQIIGLRFNKIGIPKGAVISSAYIQFGADESHDEPTRLVIRGIAEDNTDTFKLANKISTRALTTDSTVWANIPAWVAGTSGDAQKTPDLKAIVQNIVNRAGWARNNSMAFVLKGSGKRVADAFEEGAATTKVAKLVIEYFVPVTLKIAISANTDDMEEYVVSRGQDATSSDLEMTTEGGGVQIIGLRFDTISIPKNAVILNSSMQFGADESHDGPTRLVIKAQAADSAKTFSLTDLIHTRPLLEDSVQWNNIPTWVADARGDAQKTPDLTKLVQAIVNRAAWKKNNAIAFVLSGSGKRVADARDENATTTKPAELTITYLGEDGGTVIVDKPKYTIGTFPIMKASSWKYMDKGIDLTLETWTARKYTKDTSWAFNIGKLGYGMPEVNSTVEFGPNANRKYPTTYFRNTFKAMDVARYDSLVFSANVDDGAVFYINGVEVKRMNLEAGAVTYNSLAIADISGPSQTTYTRFAVKNTLLNKDTNTIAVEVHQSALNNSDLIFDLEVIGKLSKPPLSASGCIGPNDMHIACFTSLPATTKNELLNIPSSTHNMQMIVQSGMPYTIGNGTFGNGFDFTAFIPEGMKSNVKGHLSINEETDPGRVDMLDIQYDVTSKLWRVDTSRAIDFSGVVKTTRNCSGGVTPWETVITSEETRNLGDANGDGYEDVGWNVEIDPKTNKIAGYGTGKPQKLWAMGRASHENVVVAKDSITAYWGEDTGEGIVYKFVANKKLDMSEGKLYAMKLTTGLAANEPTANAGTWVMVPNTTKSDRNTTFTLAKNLGATTFSGIEDVEISPLDGRIYFTAKGNARTYRFKDNGTTVSNFETFIGGKSYSYSVGTNVFTEPWGTGNDNLTFDDRGNLYVLQDGSQDHIWMVKPDHTQEDPKVELFATTPLGSEPTGMTFSPDFRYMFISMQNPSATNTATIVDASGKTITFNKSTALVIARTPYLGGIITSTTPDNNTDGTVSVFPNPSEGRVNVKFALAKAGSVKIEVADLAGRTVVPTTTTEYSAGNHESSLLISNSGFYMVKVTTNQGVTSQKIMVK
jgi:hypothetical protein